jgi:thioredoxin 1
MSVESLRELRSVVESNKLVIADFFATWCKPCQNIKPYFAALRADYCDRVRFVLVDVDEASDAAEEFGVETMPTFIFFRDGVEVDRLLGGNQELLGEAVMKFASATQ